MFCTHCGTAAVAGSAFCQRCGKPLAASTPAQAGPAGDLPPPLPARAQPAPVTDLPPAPPPPPNLHKPVPAADLPPPLPGLDQPAPGAALPPPPRLDKPAPAADLPPPLPPLATPAPAPAMARPVPMAEPDVPEGVKGWSWGAFLLSWIWAIGNRTWIGLLALVPYIGFGIAIWLGIKGREMAWKNNHWDSLEHFNRVQKSWSRWGVGLIVGVFGLGILAAIAVPAYVSYKHRAEEAAAAQSIQDAVGDDSAAAEAPAADPAPAPVAAPAAELSDSGTIDSNADSLPAALATSAGTLVRSGELDNRRVTLDGKALFNGNDAPWQFPVRSFTLSNGREAILMASSGGRGNSCETMFFFLLIDGSDVKPTPEFGTCSPQGSFTQRGDVIALTLPKMGGMSTAELRDGSIYEDGTLVALEESNDPAQ